MITPAPEKSKMFRRIAVGGMEGGAVEEPVQVWMDDASECVSECEGEYLGLLAGCAAVSRTRIDGEEGVCLGSSVIRNENTL